MSGELKDRGFFVEATPTVARASQGHLLPRAEGAMARAQLILAQITSPTGLPRRGLAVKVLVMIL